MKRDAEHIYQQVSKGTLPAGIEYWQPLFFSEPLPPLFSYFPANTLVVNTGSLETSAERFQADTLARFENRGVDPMRPLLPPKALWLKVEELFPSLNVGLACSLKPNICRKKRLIPISDSRNYQIWLSRRSKKRRWTRYVNSLNLLAAR